MQDHQAPFPARAMLAEAIGTFSLVFIGCGAAMTDQISQGAVTHVGVSLAFGLVVMAMILATGHVSGAHLNPAVSVAFAAIGRFPWRQVPAYVATQCAAATAASALLYTSLGDAAQVGATIPSVAHTPALGLEVILTFLLMFVITAVATDDHAEGQLAAIAIGGTVALCALMGGPLTGASMNPARSLGPALMSGHLDILWLYVAGPLVGAVLGGWAYHFIRKPAPSLT